MSRALTEEQLLFWKDRIVRQAASGVSIADFCRQESVAEAKFYYWKRKLYGAARGTALEVKPKSASSNGLVRSKPGHTSFLTILAEISRFGVSFRREKLL